MLLSTAYLPSISWCVAFWNAEHVQLEACEHYQKGSLRNRAYIAGPNGLQLLSIPLLKGKHQQTPIREVRTANHEPWQRQHWRSIKTAYGNAPYFEHYADELAAYYEKPIQFLFDFNKDLIEFILVQKLGWKGTLGLSVSFDSTPGPSPFGEGGDSEFASSTWAPWRKTSEGPFAKVLVIPEKRPMSPPSPKGEGPGGGIRKFFRKNTVFCPICPS